LPTNQVWVRPLAPGRRAHFDPATRRVTVFPYDRGVSLRFDSQDDEPTPGVGPSQQCPSRTQPGAGRVTRVLSGQTSHSGQYQNRACTPRWRCCRCGFGGHAAGGREGRHAGRGNQRSNLTSLVRPVRPQELGGSSAAPSRGSMTPERGSPRPFESSLEGLQGNRSWRRT
jgi:hypothetical protein